MRLTLITISMLLASAGIGVPAYGGERAYPPLVQMPIQGVGCYWFRGNLYCSRYCYYEVDGHRYCQRRARDAVSQAPFGLMYDTAPRGYRPVK